MRTQPKRFREVDDAIDAVFASYSGTLEIDNLESAALPNKRAVIDALDRLKQVIFMGFYSTRELTQSNLRQALAEHMYAAHILLVEQIERALTYIFLFVFFP